MCASTAIFQLPRPELIVIPGLSPSQNNLSTGSQFTQTAMCIGDLLCVFDKFGL